jgi:hypothetical protein
MMKNLNNVIIKKFKNEEECVFSRLWLDNFGTTLPMKMCIISMVQLG